MSTEMSFRIAFAGLLIGMMLIAGSHRIRAQAAGGSVSQREEGWVRVPLRLGGLALWGSVLAWAINPALMSWAALPLPQWLRWAGVSLGMLVLPFGVWVTHTLGNNVTRTVVTRKDHRLVTSGPYRWVRHPLYTTGLLFFVALGLTASNAFILSGALVAITLVTVRLPKEEAMLIARFGDDYRHYRAHTGRYFPRLRMPTRGTETSGEGTA